MSLINDALKKAQRERESPTIDPAAYLVPPGAGVKPGTTPATGKNNVALLFAAAAVIVTVSVAATVYLLRHDERPDPAPGKVSTQVSDPGHGAPIAAVVSPGATTPETKVNGPAHSTPAPSPAIPAPAPSTPPPVPTEASPTPPLPDPAAHAAAPDPAQVKATYRVQGLIDKFRISGIRLDDTDSKVLLNDHLFRINDLVEPSLGLRLSGIESHLLTFTDADGNSYLKHF